MPPATGPLTHCRTCGAALPGGWGAAACPRCLVHYSVEALDPAGVFPPGAGSIALGDYELLDEIARGGMGVVYRARQRRLGRIVAVKVLAAGNFAGAEAQRRFRVEAEAVARLQHPGIVAIHDVGESDGLPWLSMDFVAGENLAALVREQPLPARQAAEYARAIAEAVQHAHDHGVLHRDLKPSNVLLDPENGPRITDFGIAHCAGTDERTRTGEVLGSPGYTAPEQALGGTADARTDVYGLGALLYHLLTARPPFQGPTVDAILLQLREADPLAPRRLNPAVPRDLETICLRCLRKEPAHRYATAREVAADLARFQRGEPILARPISAVEKTWRWCRRRPAIAALLALLVAVAALAFWNIEAARRAESGAKARAESASVQLRETNARLAVSLDRIELDRAEDLFRAGDSAGALAPLVRVIRRNPTHPVAGPRLASAFWHGDFALPVPPPLAVGGPVIQMQILRDGRTLLVCSNKGAGTWDAATGRRLLEFEHDGSRLFAAVLSPDERTLVAWGAEAGRTMTLFDAATGRQRVPPIRHEGFLHTVAFSPDSARMVTAGSEPAARIFEVRTGEPLGKPLEHPPALWSAVFSPDGETIATSAETTVRLWDARTQNLRGESAPLDRDVKRLLFSPDGRWLLAASLNGTVRLLSVADGQLAGLPLRHDGPIRAATFRADGQRLLTASQDHTARTWSVPGGEPLVPTLQHSDAVNFAAFSPDGARIVTTSLDNTARVWDARTGRPLSQPLRHFEQVNPALFTPDGATLYTGGADGVVQRWDLRGGAGTGAIFAGKCAEFSADGSRIIATARREFVRDTAELRPIPGAVEFPGGMQLARLSPSGHRAAVVTESGIIVIVPVDSAAPAETITIPHAGPVADLCFSPDGTKLATGSEDHTARVWDAATGGAVTPALAHGAPVRSVRFSPDSRALLTATWTPQTAATGLDEARLWDAATGQPIGEPMKHIDDVASAEFSPDGLLVATGSDDNTARVWDAHTGVPISPVLRHARSVERVAFSPDSGRLVTASWDGTARVWNARTGAPLARALTHDDYVTDVCFSPDGRRIATASRDKTARVWDASSGQPLTEPLRHDAPVEQVRFHPDGQRLITSTAGTYRIWDVPDFPTPPPAWLPTIAETISLAELPAEPSVTIAHIARYEQARQEALAPGDNPAFKRLAKRLFGSNAVDVENLHGR